MRLKWQQNMECFFTILEITIFQINVSETISTNHGILSRVIYEIAHKICV